MRRLWLKRGCLNLLPVQLDRIVWFSGMSGMNASNRIQKVEAVVITHPRFWRGDRILHAFTAEHLAKFQLLQTGQGSRVPKSAAIERSLIAPGAGSGQIIWILTQADTLEHFQTDLQASLYRTGLVLIF